jgi:hypothetical protein
MDDFNQLDGLNDKIEDHHPKDDPDMYNTRKKEINNWYDVERTKNTSAVITEFTLSNMNMDVNIRNFL